MSKKYQLSKIKSSHYYTFLEISELLGVHVRTVQGWHKDGLNVLDENRRPFLVEGKSLIEYLKRKRAARRTPLQPDESYCVKCKAARKGSAGTQEIITTGKTLGENAKQVIIRAKCEKCGCSIWKYTSDRKIKMLENCNPKYKEEDKSLNENSSSKLRVYQNKKKQ